MARPPILSIVILLLFSVFSYDALLGQLKRNGMVAAIDDIVSDPAPRFLPYSQPTYGVEGRLKTGEASIEEKILEQIKPSKQDPRPLLRHYTGLKQLDHLLATLNVAFAHTADGSAPEFSLFCIHLAGQAMAAFVVIVVEGLRAGSRGNAMRLPFVAIWGMLVQTLGFAVAVPIWCIVHLLTTGNTTVPAKEAKKSKSKSKPKQIPMSNPSPVAPSRPLIDSVLLYDNATLHTIIPAFLLGFVLPTVVAGYPFSYYNYRQQANAVWQFFPIYITLLCLIFGEVAKRNSIGVTGHLSASERDRAVLKTTYEFAMVTSTLTHWFTCAVIVTAHMSPALFPGDLASCFRWKRVFFPAALPHSWEPMTSPAQALHDFFIIDEYFGVGAMVVWAVTLAVRAGTMRVGLDAVKGIARDWMLVGPGAALVHVMMEKDFAVLDREKKQL